LELIRSFGNGCGTGLEFDHKLDISVWWHTRQLFRKDIRVLAHYWNFIKRGDNGHIGTRIDIVLER
jgi:hypothetical protein